MQVDHKVIPDLSPDEITRFWKNVSSIDKPDSCWIWKTTWLTAKRHVFEVNREYYNIVEIAYKLQFNDQPPERNIQRICRNKLCLNAAHFTLRLTRNPKIMPRPQQG